MVHLYYHGGSGNHGCEAIVRATLGILTQNAILHTSNITSDLKYGLDKIIPLAEDIARPLDKWSLQYILFAMHHKLTGSDHFHTRFAHAPFFSGVKKGDICLSIGGDNYCYRGTDILASYNKILNGKGAKTVLWGCSVEPKLINNPAIAKDLSRYSLITARESISYKALKSVNPHTALVADPAFLLEREELPLPKEWIEGKMVGINASPLILDSGNGNEVFQAYRKLVRRILDTTELSVVLIPHVVLPTSDDRKVLAPLYEEFRCSGRVIMLGDHNCMELKGYIARCRMFIGARTHATIAAYSGCVPTLALGYSVKAIGIARDLFGTEDGYVLPMQQLSDAEALARGFDWLLENEYAIRQYLKKTIPEYKMRAFMSDELLKRITED